jgi:stearoyl-CoA desaturase (delta-9 desaturase)
VPRVLLAFLVGLALTQIGLLLTTVYLHRALSHKALTVSRPVSWVFRFLIWLTTGIRPRQWVAVHRRHHAFTDVEGDPHSPVLLGFWQVQLGNVYLYKRAIKEGEATMRYAKDLPPDRWDTLLLDHAILGLGIGIALLCLVFGWEVGLMAAGFHTVLYLSLNAAVNAIGHKFGSKVYENGARNNQWLAWLAAGEGLHNNHHAMPTSAKLALHKREIDPGYWLVWALKKTGQAKVRLSATRAAAGAAAREKASAVAAGAAQAATTAAQAASNAAHAAGSAVATAVGPKPSPAGVSTSSKALNRADPRRLTAQ